MKKIWPILVAGLLAILCANPLNSKPIVQPKTANTATAEKEYGDAWAELGNWKRAALHYQKAIQLDPKMNSVRLSLANGLYLTGDKEGALKALSDLQAIEPRSVAVACSIGVVQLDLHHPEKACESFVNALNLEKDYPRAVYGMGQCHEALYEKISQESEKQLAMDSFQNYLKLYPNGPYVIPSKESIDRLIYGAIGKLLTEAKDAFAQGKFRIAENMFREVVSKRPDLQEGHYLLGMTLSNPVINKMGEAETEWKKAGKMKEALLQRGILSFEEDDLEQAEDLLKDAISIDASYAPAHYHLGLVYQNQLKNEEAAKAFGQVVALVPSTELGDQANSKLQVLTGQIFYLREGEIIDTASEVELGRKITTEIEKQFGLYNDPVLSEKLYNILKQIVAHSDRLPGAVPYQIKILNVDAINALSFVGGTIYIFKGLVDFINRNFEEPDDVLANVIGHEVVHIVNRHGLGMLDLVGGTRSLMEGQSLDVVGLNKLMLGMSRKHEFEADQLGSLYAYRSGFNPAAAYQFHQEIVSKGQEVPEGLDHPTHNERAIQLKEYLLGLRAKARHFDEGLKALDTDDYETAITHFNIFLGLFPSSVAARNNLGVALQRMALAVKQPKRGFKLSTDIDPRSHVEAIRLRSGSGQSIAVDRLLAREAAEDFQTILTSNPGYDLAQLNLSSALVSLGQTTQAEEILGKFLKKNPGSPEAKTNLAVLKLTNNQAESGVKLLEETIKSSPGFADAHYNLALAMQQAGKKDAARREWLKFLEIDKNSGWAESARTYLKEIQ